MTVRSTRRGGIALALAVVAMTAGPIGAEAQQTPDSPSAVSVEGNTVTLADGTQVTLDQAAIDALNAGLSDPDAPDAAQRLQSALAEVSGGDGSLLAAAAAYASSQQPTLASAIAVAAIRASATPGDATLAVANVNATPGVEPNRIAAAIDSAAGLDPASRQAGLDGMAGGGPVAGGPPEQLPTLPQQALAGQAIDTSENPAQDDVSPVQ